MSDIAGISFDIMRGKPVLLAEEVETWRISGLDGYGAQKLGLGDGEFRLVTIVYVDDDGLAANAVIDASRALQGTIVDLEDDWGDVYEGVLVRRVDASGPNVQTPVKKDGQAKVRVQLVWDMLKAVV